MNSLKELRFSKKVVELLNGDELWACAELLETRCAL